MFTTKRATIVCFLKEILQGACADVFTRLTLLGLHANGRNIVALRFAGHSNNVGTCWAKSLTGFKLYATTANIVMVPYKRTQQVTTLLGPTMLGVVGQQCCVRLHGPLGLLETEAKSEYKKLCLYLYLPCASNLNVIFTPIFQTTQSDSAR